MPLGVCTIRRKLPLLVPNSGIPPVRQRSANELSSGPSLRFMRAVLYRRARSACRGEGAGSYLPPLQVASSFLHVSVTVPINLELVPGSLRKFADHVIE